MSPKHFAQLWIIRGFIKGICFPLAYCLLQDKHHSTYSRCLQEICTFAPHFYPTLVMLDFELAEHNALHRVFPNVRIQGCYFHHKQCLHKIFAALPGYKDTLDMRKHVNSIYGLAFVPVADVLRTWEDLKNLLTLLYPQVVGPVITYFESTWLYGDYPIQLWNVHTCTLHGDPRTNNYAEGGNNAINQSMGVNNPTIYKFTENLQLYNCEAETQLLQLDTRLSNPRRPTRNAENDRKAAIQAIVAGYDVNSRVVYCRSLGYWYS